MPDGNQQNQHALTITDSAAARISKLQEIEGKPELMLRITVNGGGCSGFQYAFDLVEASTDEDLKFDHNGSSVVTDTVSIEFIEGCVVDFKNELGAAYFAIDNPNATSSCGCGTSFAI